MAYNAKTGQTVADEKPGDFPTYAPASGGGGGYDFSKVIAPTTQAGLDNLNKGTYSFGGQTNTYEPQLLEALKKNTQAVVNSQSAKTDLSKIQTDFQSMLTSIQNKQAYNQTGLNPNNSLVDLMKSKGIADTSEAARAKLAQSAGISDYNSSNAESNKKLAEAIMSSKAVGSAMSQMTPGTPAYDSAMGKVAETVGKANPVAPAQAPQEALTSIGTKVSEDPMTAKYDEVTAQIDKNSSDITSSLNQLRTGAIPLTADQQATIDATQQAFNNAIATQKSANQSQENTFKMAAYRNGSEYTPEVSSTIIKSVIDANVLKIKEYDMQAIGAISKLKQDFKDANYKAIKEGYDSLQKTLKDKQDNMLSLMKLSHDYEKESLNYGLSVLKYKEDVRHNTATETNTANKTNGLTDPQQIAVFNRLVDKADKSPLILAADRTPVLKATIQNIKNDPSNAAQQLNLVYAYVQALDTYQSAVREGELGLVNNIDSKIGQLSSSIQKIQNGQIVRPEVALQIADAANTLVDTIDSAAKTKIQSFRSQANVSGISDKFDEYLGGVNSSYGGSQSTGGQPITIDSAFIQNMMNEGKSNAEVQQAIKDAKEYNASLSNVGGDTNQASVIANAIKQVESQGNYQAKGGSGETGAYQFMPATWKEWAGDYLGNPNAPMTQQNQDKVAQAKISDLLNQGYGAKEIALIWNGGQPKEKKGVNKYGVAYDSGAYANKVLKALNQIA
jgi:ribosomal protein S20